MGTLLSPRTLCEFVKESLEKVGMCLFRDPEDSKITSEPNKEAV